MTPPSIMIVEDDAGIREILRTRLAASGFRVETARTGREALVRLAAFEAEAMVLDINMPEMDGFELLQRLGRERAALPNTLVLTARHAAEDVRRAVLLGAKDYLTKPFTEAQLLARVARLLRTPRVDPTARVIRL